jgi:hypothetical protein
LRGDWRCRVIKLFAFYKQHHRFGSAFVETGFHDGV